MLTTLKNNLLKNKLVVTLLALLCTALWGTAFAAIKQGYKIFSIESNDIPSMLVFAGVRFFSAGVVVYIALTIMRKKFFVPKQRELVKMTSLGIMQTALQYIFLYVALVFVTGTKSSIYTSFSAFLGVLLAPLFFKGDKITAKKLIGCCIGFCGIVLINIGGGNFIGEFSFIGDSFLFLSNLCGAFGNIFAKKISKDSDPVFVSAAQLTIGGGLLIIIGMLFSGGIAFTSLDCFIVMAYLSLISSVSFAIWTVLLKHNDVSIISTFTLMIPVFGTITSGIVLGENIFTIPNLISILLVTAGIVFVNLRRNVNEHN